MQNTKALRATSDHGRVERYEVAKVKVNKQDASSTLATKGRATHKATIFDSPKSLEMASDSDLSAQTRGTTFHFVLRQTPNLIPETE